MCTTVSILILHFCFGRMPKPDRKPPFQQDTSVPSRKPLFRFSLFPIPFRRRNVSTHQSFPTGDLHPLVVLYLLHAVDCIDIVE